MSSRGIVMEKSEKHYIILTPDGQFQKITRVPGSSFDIGDEVTGSRRRRRPRRVIGAWIAGAVALLLLFPMFMVPTSQAAPVVAYVSLDVNPSVEMGIDDEEQVRELRGLNEQGSSIIVNMKYKGLNAAVVAAEIVERASQTKAEINISSKDDRDIVITSVMLDGKAKDPERFEAELESDIHKAVTDKLHAGELGTPANDSKPGNDGITMLSAPEEVREEAEKNGVSAGKMAVYLLVKSENPDVQLDTLKTQSIHEWTAPVGGIHQLVPPVPPANAAPQTDLPKEKENEPLSKEQKLKHAEARQKWEKQRLKALLKQEKTNASSIADNKNANSDNGKKEEQGEKENLNNNKQTSSPPKNAGKDGQTKGKGNDQQGSSKNQNRDDDRSDSRKGNSSASQTPQSQQHGNSRSDNQQRSNGKDDGRSSNNDRNNNNNQDRKSNSQKENERDDDRSSHDKDDDNDRERGNSDHQDSRNSNGSNKSNSNGNNNSSANKTNKNDKNKEDHSNKQNQK
ncbi:conserved hypothetical protein [Paenibacillus curdlanolyticus YK9]|uniref:RsgI N-terminal anti-sigma domain-containing protein n=1 Tax=Paenibacillus curdlanolyticus YK9 TaxID=717606 RepID=E0I6J6_9BACL|nr:anti-sigma factor domain-containing protein [Paenibacillus curdlanolyticus]EFM11662.1 conserved hypothetical protein [Paenibacillus curdlanolyticus YK9]